MSIKFWIRSTLLEKFLQSEMIFFIQFKVPTVKLGKCFSLIYSADYILLLVLLDQIMHSKNSKIIIRLDSFSKLGTFIFTYISL